MTRRIVAFFYDLADLLNRGDLSTAHKLRVLAALSGLRFATGNHVSFLGYSIHGESRANVVGIVKEVFLKGDYVFQTDAPAPRIIDAGGNIGITTLFFKQQFPNAHIQVFEAAKRNHELLKQNVTDNHLSDVQVVFGALGKTEGTRTLYFNEKKPGGSTMSPDVVSSKTTSVFVPEDVPALQLSRFIEEDIDLLKLDVEGAEGEILEELESSGALSRIKQIVMEYHANPSNESNDLTTLMGRLERSGFSLVLYDNEHGAYGKLLKKAPHYHFMIRAFR